MHNSNKKQNNKIKFNTKNIANIKEESRKIQIMDALKENKLENIKPSLCKSYIKFESPSLEDIIELFKKEQNNKETRLENLIKELKLSGKKYDDNVPSYLKYVKEGGSIKYAIEEGEIERSLVYATKYLHYLKHNDVQTARYLATIEFMNSGKRDDVIHKFASNKNTLCWN
jgi:hypothetical protein